MRSAYREAALQRLQKAEEEFQRTSFIVKALQLKEQFPEVGTIELYSDDEIVRVSRALDRDGNKLGREVAQEMNQHSFRWEPAGDYTTIVDGKVFSPAPRSTSMRQSPGGRRSDRPGRAPLRRGFLLSGPSQQAAAGPSSLQPHRTKGELICIWLLQGVHRRCRRSSVQSASAGGGPQ